MADLGNTKVRKVGSPEGRPSLVLDRPADKSLAAFKRWIGRMIDALGGEQGGMTEEEWRDAWKKFWSGESVS